ncbi:MULTISPECIES: aspartyl-phosphate phosphatase Spo0E family protein [Bacillus]|uniref:aspartyl-phosphate phosphatase Spo0E family protein n=1 Tax=Bacillus TaxID=1386 RepID=UPI00047B8877|nr:MULTISPECIES: aspartyl-phosphate phosphatase Spo0E family protein [Bacillus]QHZ46179.1 aspartyl-phosphate phosphatase Spo0E family protein [Bacillus sp. NSP9.1]WFA07369.1 aspartyl-phosphate phosphatase Spo0E family protein [Bacillus sp. HSf4]
MNNKIEAKRLALIETAEKFGINSKEAIQCSQELDSLLNQRMQKQENSLLQEDTFKNANQRTF